MAEGSKTSEHGRPEAVKMAVEMAKNRGGFSQSFSVMFEIFAEILVICGFFWRSLVILWIFLEGFRDFVVFSGEFS